MNSMCWVFNGKSETVLETDAVGECFQPGQITTAQSRISDHVKYAVLLKVPMQA